ncbi:hypothetical protein Pmar_PMAR009553 [Perkinsus marinus ATCC 50983]|uniref:Thioredoxin domain-containing protein n=1 Tax=Perkinsus marinus (strain ATCC 50983 / TXsc) TaxID=423536 RepID=C5KEI0_PERM5|nr:hypothetical protein Pmar_PMAR009553 [Perkinsus marinus ATCC 50983]EER17118.1 hypothetical protein Pmar_PMAR009553 [Perkinsus marinus ATCC 50983]|eukprot:XP_002785322.1 hypothetical protein Pmar_PMAR009553 [Perkinsus marinus ATCC 50983]
MPELMKARDELRRSLWKRLLMDFEIEGLADILTVVVPRVASAEVGLWRATDGIDRLSPVSEAWELLHGVQVMFNQWFGLNPTSGASQVLTYDPFADTKHLSVTINEDDSLSSFVGDFIVAVVQEEVLPLVVSQSAEKAAEVANEVHPEIHALTAESISEFLSIPAAPMKLHLLLLYAPWCVHCLTFLWHVLHPLVEALSVTNGEVLARYPMFDTSNMTKVIEWMEIIFNTVGVSESSQKDEL